MPSHRFVEQIDDRLRADLMELYHHEWWTDHRREEDVVRMLEIQHVLDHPMLAQVGHIELYCRPDLIHFYEKWGFTTSMSGINLMRKERGGTVTETDD